MKQRMRVWAAALGLAAACSVPLTAAAAEQILNDVAVTTDNGIGGNGNRTQVILSRNVNIDNQTLRSLKMVTDVPADSSRVQYVGRHFIAVQARCRTLRITSFSIDDSLTGIGEHCTMTRADSD